MKTKNCNDYLLRNDARLICLLSFDLLGLRILALNASALWLRAPPPQVFLISYLSLNWDFTKSMILLKRTSSAPSTCLVKIHIKTQALVQNTPLRIQQEQVWKAWSEWLACSSPHPYAYINCSHPQKGSMPQGYPREERVINMRHVKNYPKKSSRWTF